MHGEMEVFPCRGGYHCNRYHGTLGHRVFSDFRTYSLGQGTALANGNPVTLLNTESGGDVGSQVLVALLVTVVLGDVVEVLAANDNGTVHLGGDDTAGQDTATDGNETSEGALLVCWKLLVAYLSEICSRLECPQYLQSFLSELKMETMDDK